MNDNDTSVIETKFLRMLKMPQLFRKTNRIKCHWKGKRLFISCLRLIFAKTVHTGSWNTAVFHRDLKNYCFSINGSWQYPWWRRYSLSLFYFYPERNPLQPPDSTPPSRNPCKKERGSLQCRANGSLHWNWKTRKSDHRRKTGPEPIQKGEGEGEKPKAATSPVILNKTESTRTSIKVFSATTIKVRSSAPNTVSPAHKWSFRKKTITIKREVHQHVYVAGDSTGTQKWAVDDRLIINGKVYEGLSASYNNKGGSLPGKAKRRPLDITHLVVPDQETPLNIELVDHGKFWANTEIHIVVK